MAEHRSRKPGVESSILSVAYFCNDCCSLAGAGAAAAAAAGALSSVEERPFRIREVEGSNPSVSTIFSRYCGQQQHLSVAQLVEHVTVDVCDHRVAGSIPAAETL